MGRGKSDKVNSSFRTSLNNAVKNKDVKSVAKILHDNLNKGDSIYITESDGNEYEYTVTNKVTRPGSTNLEFSANLPRELAYETGGRVSTAQMHYWLVNGRRKWRLK